VQHFHGRERIQPRREPDTVQETLRTLVMRWVECPRRRPRNTTLQPRELTTSPLEKPQVSSVEQPPGRNGSPLAGREASARDRPKECRLRLISLRFRYRRNARRRRAQPVSRSVCRADVSQGLQMTAGHPRARRDSYRQSPRLERMKLFRVREPAKFDSIAGVCVRGFNQRRREGNLLRSFKQQPALTSVPSVGSPW